MVARPVRRLVQELTAMPRAEAAVGIVGAGPAGAAVAGVLAAAGIAHDIYDEAPRSGGNLDRRRFDAPPSALERGGLGRLIAGASVLAVTEDRVVEFARGDGIEQRAYRAVFICTGAYDLQLPSRGRAAAWSSAGALQALLKGQGIVPRGRVVLSGAGPFLTIVGADLVRAGATVTDIVDAVGLADYARCCRRAPGSPAWWRSSCARWRRCGAPARSCISACRPSRSTRSRCGSPTGGCCRSTGSASAIASRRRPSSPARPAAARPIAVPAITFIPRPTRRVAPTGPASSSAARGRGCAAAAMRAPAVRSPPAPGWPTRAARCRPASRGCAGGPPGCAASARRWSGSSRSAPGRSPTRPGFAAASASPPGPCARPSPPASPISARSRSSPAAAWAIARGAIASR